MQKTDKKSAGSICLPMLLKRSGFFLSLLAVVAMAVVVVLYRHFCEDIPKVLTPQDYRPALKSKVYAQDGQLIAEFGFYEHVLLERDALPLLVKQAFIASEDKNFYNHHGIDFLGIINAIRQSLVGNRASLRGASTLSQQLAKGLLIKEEGYEQATARTLARKIKEAILARRLEMDLNKEDILWMYLNEVYLGHGSYGVAAASRNYFRKDLADLGLNEIAILAGLPQAPSRFSPQVNMSAALARQSYVLRRMLDDGFISTQQMEGAFKDNQHLKVYERENRFRDAAPYFSETIRRQLMEQFGEEQVYEGGLEIFTTLDLHHEHAMQDVLKDGLLQIDKRQGYSGPIFTPEGDAQARVARGLVKSINLERTIELGHGYSLAVVERVDDGHNAVYIDTGFERGVIPLAGMLWARPREPSANYAWSKLSNVRGVLKKGDVILVKKSNKPDLELLNRDARNRGWLGKLLSHERMALGENRLVLYTLEQEPEIEGAMLSIDPASGYVTGMNGGYSFNKSEFNRVYQSCRQPGSVFKPVVYSAAIALKGYTPATMVMDTPLTFRDVGNESSWKPKNFGNGYKGEVTVREAIMKSMNVPALNVMADVGTKNVLSWAKRLGIDTELKSELGTAIGSSCITPWELAKVFSTIANMGIKKEPILIKEILDRDKQRIRFKASGSDPFIARTDRVLSFVEDYFSHEGNRVMAEEDAFTTHYLLTQVIRHGTAKRLSGLKKNLAGKTGTTNDSFDTWFAGYTKSLLALVWVGSDTMDVPLGVYEQGARTALPLFGGFMDRVLTHVPDADWPMPENMCEARVDAKSGGGLDFEHPLSFVAPFRCGQEPKPIESIKNHSLEQAMEIMGGL